LHDSAGDSLVRVEGALGEYRWWGFDHVHALYQYDKSFFRPDSASEYVLRVKYSPAPELQGRTGRVYLRCQAHW
jgi:hypothetical protein